jgi:hypothetical protein
MTGGEAVHHMLLPLRTALSAKQKKFHCDKKSFIKAAVQHTVLRTHVVEVVCSALDIDRGLPTNVSS